MSDSKKIAPILVLLLLSFAYPQSITRPANYIIKPEFRIEKLPFGLNEKIPEPQPKIALALSGGGARGIAQIGVIKALEEAGIKIDIIVGTSMGSIIGGLYAAGYSTGQLDSIVRNTDWDEMLSATRETDREDLFIDQKVTEDKAIFALRLKGFTPVLPTSLNEGQKLSNYLNLLAFQAPVHVKNHFDELKVKFRAVCTDLVSGTPVILEKGSLSQAMRASSSVSFFLSPVRMDSLILVDGGLVANIPVRIAFDLGADIVIAVNTTSSLHIREDLNLPWYIADQVVSIPMRLLNEHQLEKADIVIHPPLEERSATDFTDLEEVISEGYKYTLPFIEDIKSRTDSLFDKNIEQEVFYVTNVHNDNEAPPEELKLLRKYAAKDSVSSLEIIHDLYSFSKTINSESMRAEIFTDSSGTKIDFVSESNPVLKNVDLHGATVIHGDKCDSIFSDLTGKPYNPEELYGNIRELINTYRSFGYSLAEVDTMIFNEETGRLEISIDEGMIDEVRVEGNEHTNRSVITREFPINGGDYFRYEDLAAGLINLHSTNLFDDISVDVIRKNDHNILVLRVLEATSGLMRFGFRIDNENKAQLSVDIRDENLLGTATELGVLLFGGTRNRAFIIEHKSNRIFNTYLTYNINAFYQFQDIFSYVNSPNSTDHRFSRLIAGEYRQINYGTSLAIGTQVERLGNLIFKGKYQFDEVKNLTESTIGPYKIKIVSLKISSTIDSQNKYPYPTAGVYFTGSYESASSFLGGDIGFTNIGFDYKSHFTINDVHTFSPRIMMGFGDKTLPLSQHYSLGGQSSFFGMRDNDFRGRQILVSSLEYTIKLPIQIFFDTYFKLRYDLGSAWEEQEEIRFKDLRHGVGGTLSFDTPVGPADFSVGQSFLFKRNLPENPVSLGEVHFYFSIGYYY